MIDNWVNGHTHFSGLKMCPVISDLFLFIFDYSNVGHEMCQVLLLPVVMKFGPNSLGDAV